MKQQSGLSVVEGLLVIAVVGIVGFGGWYVWNRNPEEAPTNNITSYEKCVAAGHPIMESYPEQCVVPGGASFTRVLTQEEQNSPEIEEKPTGSTSPTGWTTYTNIVDAYSFAYPEGWFVDEGGSTSVNINPSKDGGIPNIYVWLAELDNSSCDQTTNQLNDVVVDGLPAKQFSGGQQTKTITTCVVKNNKVYHIVHAYAYNTDADHLLDEYKQLLSTFKFR